METPSVSNPAEAIQGLERFVVKKPGLLGTALFLAVLIAGAVYAVASLTHDLSTVRSPGIWPYFLLGVALFIALAFEFVNGFHDTANAVATVIYTHSLEPHLAVSWSGICNLVGVLLSTGGVAYGIVALLPVELILQVGSGAGFAMVFALLISAIIWNLATWWRGLPASSSHTLIGSILGVGLANQLMGLKSGTSGVDWGQALKVAESLFFSPLIGFAMAGLLLALAKAVIKVPELYEAPKSKEPPPFWIRLLLLCTCTGVSYFHGSNDGQKGMGLIMLILIGTVPTAFALNRAVTPQQSADFIAISKHTVEVVSKYVDPSTVIQDPYDEVKNYVSSHKYTPSAMLGLRQMMTDVANQMAIYKSLKNVPVEKTRNFRNDLFLISEAIRLIDGSKTPILSKPDQVAVANYKKHVDGAIKFIPDWVKVAVAIALGMGTMVGWKRIVVTVGEKIGKAHLTYGQGAAAEITAMVTIGMADRLDLPVSTTHVLSSGVAGTMMANGSGLQWNTVRNIALAWVLTLPVAIVLAGSLFYLFRAMAGA